MLPGHDYVFVGHRDVLDAPFAELTKALVTRISSRHKQRAGHRERMMQQNRNYYLAIVLSVLIVFVWQFFYMGPKMEAQRLRDEAHQAELAKQKKVDAVTAHEARGA